VPLIARVRSRYPGYFDASQYESAAQEAFLSYYRSPQVYKPTKDLALFSFLVMAARRDFLNLRTRDNRQTQGQQGLVVEDQDDAPELDIVDPRYEDFEEVLARNDSIVWEHIAQALPDERDQCCVYMMMQRERSYPVFVEIYGLASLSPEEQEHEVKKHKDRVKKRLLRKLDPERYRRHD